MTDLPSGALKDVRTRVARTTLERMLGLSGEDGPWNRVPSDIGLPTIRFTRTHTTPDYMRGSGFGRWDQDTYNDHVFLTLVTGKVILGTSAAPWVGRSDREIPFWLALAILEDPTLAHDTTRQLDLKHARRGGRRGDGVR